LAAAAQKLDRRKMKRIKSANRYRKRFQRSREHRHGRFHQRDAADQFPHRIAVRALQPARMDPILHFVFEQPA
jgi:hypothetical protein